MSENEGGRTPLLGEPEGSAARAGKDANNAFGQARRAEDVGYNAQISATEALQVARFGAVEARRVTVGDFENLARNGSFLDLDDDDEPTLAPWSPRVSALSVDRWSLHTVNTRTGAQALRYSPEGDDTTGRITANAALGDVLGHAPAIPGEKYDFSAYVRPSGSGTKARAALEIFAYDKDGTSLGSVASTGWLSPAAFAYTRVRTLSEPMPAGTVLAAFELQVEDATGVSATSWMMFDDVRARRAIEADLLVSGAIKSGEGIQSFDYDGDGTAADAGTKGWFLGGDGQLHGQDASLRGNLTSEDVSADGAYVGTVSAGQLGMNWRRTDDVVVPGGSVRTSILDVDPALAAGDCGMGLYGGMNLALELFDNSKNFAYGDWAWTGASGMNNTLQIGSGGNFISQASDFLTMYTRGSLGSDGWRVRGSATAAFNDLLVVNTGGNVEVPNGRLLVDGSIGAAGAVNGSSIVGATSVQGLYYVTGSYLAVSRGGGPCIYANRVNNGSAIGLRRAGTDVGSISVTTTATSFNTSSDYRLKENARPIDTPLALLGKLNPITFDWKDHPEEGPAQGFLAHEVAEHVPQAVLGEKDAVDEDGKPDYQSLDHSKLVPLLVAAVQELTARVAELEAG